MGLAMMRYVWKIEPVVAMTDDEIVAAVAPNLQRYIDGDAADDPAPMRLGGACGAHVDWSIGLRRQ